MDLVFSSWQEIPFSENHIKQLHQILLRYSEKDAWHCGRYKTSSNSVERKHDKLKLAFTAGFTARPRSCHHVRDLTHNSPGGTPRRGC